MMKLISSPLFVSVRVMLQLIGFVRMAMWVVKGMVWVIEFSRGHRIGPRNADPCCGLDTVFNTEAYQWIQMLRTAMTVTVAIDWLLRKECQAMAAANRGVFALPWTIDARLGPASAYGALSVEPDSAPVWTLHDEKDVARTSPFVVYNAGATPARVIASVPSVRDSW